MIYTQTVSTTLLNTLWPSQSIQKTILVAFLTSMIFWLSAKVQVMLVPVPVTLQGYAVLVSAALLGRRLAFLAVLTYLIEGALGLPVFAGTPEKGIGLAYMVGPTGGYLLGFLIAATIVGWFADHSWDRNWFKSLIMMSVGQAIIFTLGLIWLSQFLGWQGALTHGFMPFWKIDLTKMILAVSTPPLIWSIFSFFKKKTP
ncbi:MAG: biotin transporter BioY [Alphaproteobacteria bacterium]|nr:biotin transporter BioY [Alphaproteobacteria bacterium]